MVEAGLEASGPRRQSATYERTKRSRLTQSGFLGLKLMNLLNKTWATGAMPIGAPGWPEFALNVASTYIERRLSALSYKACDSHGMKALNEAVGTARW